MRFLLLLLIIGLAAAWFLGYLPAPRPAAYVRAPESHGQPIDTEAARQRGSAIAETFARGVNRVAQEVDDVALAAKIKSKMTLDELVSARRLNVESRGGRVVLSGQVAGESERQRALQLARETAGVTAVDDRMSLSAGR